MRQEPQRVLIAGASVAGPVLAFWLQRHGCQPTIVEKAPGLRPGGHALDVRGAAIEVAARMGILPALQARTTAMRGMSMFDHHGRKLFLTTEATLSGGRRDSGDVEILRDELCGILHDATRAHTDYIFNDSIRTLVEDDHGVLVTFERGPSRRFDLVVGADGLHSHVRRLVFGPESDVVTHLGQYLAVFTTPNFLRLDRWQVWMRPHAGRNGGLMSARNNTEARAYLGFESDLLTFDRRDLLAQRRIVAERFAGIGWVVPQLLTYMAVAPDFHFDSMSQVRMATWSRGRVALVGDAAYSSSPTSGQATSLAMVGAYVLADELRRADGDASVAYAAYETRLRPWVAQNQELALVNIERARAAAEGRDPTTVPGVDTDTVKNAVTLAV
jgi:2-polyprenyl-6-methoxyphenol hydroxylase-like FAD-dependent oxidoreductase